MPGYNLQAGPRRDTWKTAWIAFHFEGKDSLNAFFEISSMISKGPSFFSDNFLVGRVNLMLQESSQTLSPTLKGGKACQRRSA